MQRSNNLINPVLCFVLFILVCFLLLWYSDKIYISFIATYTMKTTSSLFTQLEFDGQHHCQCLVWLIKSSVEKFFFVLSILNWDFSTTDTLFRNIRPSNLFPVILFQIGGIRRITSRISYKWVDVGNNL